MDMVYTYGGGSVLYMLFNGIGALSAKGSSYWTIFIIPVVMIGGLWGAAVAMAQTNIGLFGRKWFIPSYLLLSVLLVPKTTLWIKDEVDTGFGLSKVDGVPMGLVLVAGVSSTLSRAMTEMIENTFTTGDLTKFTKTGYAFASRLSQEARTVRIKDPLLLENIKDWTRQCIVLPYLKGNIKGKREDVLHASNVVEWVQGKGHPSLGTYWRDAQGTPSYKTCKETATEVNLALTTEQDRGLSSLAGRLLGFSSKEGSLKALKPYMEEAWNRIGGLTRTAGQHIQQILVVNALKESVDDARERSGYPRMHPELVSLNAARALEAQGMTGLIKGAASAVSLPLLQAFLFGVLCLVFFLVIPFCFMPGGITLFGLWIKMMISVQLWPVFSCLLNAVSFLWLDRASEEVLMGSKAFSIATTTGLTEAAWSVASWSAGIQLLVPVLSWAFISKSGHMLTTVVQSATSSMEGSAARLASDAVDGNASLNNLSMMNRTLASESIAQQTWGMNASFGSTLNTGDRSIVSSPSGEHLVHQNMSKLSTDLTSTDSLAASLGASYRDAQALTFQKANAFNSTLQETSGEMLSFVERVAKGASQSHGIDEREQASMQKEAQEFLGAAEALKRDHNINAQTAATATLAGTFGRVLGKMGFSPEFKGSAQDQEALDKAMSTDAGKRFTKALGNLTQYAQQHGSQIQDSSGKDASSSLQHSLSKLQSEGESLSRSYTRSQNLEKLKNFTENHSFGASSNENDEWLAFVATQKGFSKVDASSFIETHQTEARSLMARYMNDKKSALMKYVEGADHVLSNQEMDSFMNQKDRVINAEGRDVVQNAITQSRFESDEALRANHANQMNVYEERAHQNEAHIQKTNDRIHHQNSSLQEVFTQEKGKMNVTRLVGKSYDDAVNTWEGPVSATVEKIKDIKRKLRE